MKEKVFTKKKNLYENLSYEIKKEINKDKKEKVLIFSGGKSLINFYKNFKNEPIDWTKLTFSLTDERCVPVDNIQSNFFHLKKHFLDKIGSKSKYVKFYDKKLSIKKKYKKD